MGPDLGCYGAPLAQTPHLDRLAREGMRYRLAFSTAPMCSPSRSAFMTGMYKTAIGAHNHRSHRHDHFRLPDGVRPITHWLRDAGYYTANIRTMDGRQVGTAKTDLNFEVEGEPLRNTPGDQTRRARASKDGVDANLQNVENEVRLFHTDNWADLKQRQPFFAQVNLPTVERSRDGWTGSKANPAFGAQIHPERIDPAKVIVPPYYPDHPVTRKDWAGYLDAVCAVDDRAGEILKKLAADGLADDTVVIFFADNGRLEHRGHGWCYDSGDRVPLIIRWPKNFPAPPQYRAGSVSEQLISLLDLTATTLNLAGVKKPGGMQSRAFLGGNAAAPRTVVFSARDRHDEAVQRIRAARSTRYRYIRNFMPEFPLSALHRYKEACYPVVPLLRELRAQRKLTGPPLALMAPRLPDEELYDLETDPYEIRNLASSRKPEHQRVLMEMRGALNQWIETTNDQGRTPEPAGQLRQWVERMDQWFGTPAWAQASAAKASGGSAPAALTLAAVLRDETALTGAHDVEVREGIAYLAGKGGSLAIVDVKQPAAPKLLWSVRDAQTYEDAETVLPLGKDRLLVGTRDVFLFDVSQPAEPKLLAKVGNRPRVDIINGFARLGDAVFGANKVGHIFALDVSAPDTIKLLGSRETKRSGELGSPHDAAFCGDLLVIVSPEGFGRTSGPGRLAVYRVTDQKTRQALPPEQWTLVGKLEHPRLAGANRVMARGQFAYVGSSLTQNLDRADGLRGNVSVIDLADPAQPKLRGGVDFPDARGPNGLEVAGAVVFAAGGKTVQAIDVSNPDAPREAARFTSAEVFPGGADDAHDLVFRDGHLFITAQTTHALVILKAGEKPRRSP